MSQETQEEEAHRLIQAHLGAKSAWVQAATWRRHKLMPAVQSTYDALMSATVTGVRVLRLKGGE